MTFNENSPESSPAASGDARRDERKDSPDDVAKALLHFQLSKPEHLLHMPLPPNSPAYSEETTPTELSSDPVWSILPLYHMYTSTLNKSLDVGNDETVSVPPTYDDISTLWSGKSDGNADPSQPRSSLSASALTSLMSRSSDQLTDSANSMADSEFIVADESTGQWQNTILDNIQKLKNLSELETNDFSKALKLDVVFTEEVGQIGVPPKILDVLKYEYKQGDLINGYILLENTSDVPIPFDMFYVQFEGNFTVSNPVIGKRGLLNTRDYNDTKVQKKFLEMFDFSASWHYGHINRLVTEYSNDYTCPNLIDPVDNTRTSLGIERQVLPKAVHKRFFTFKIPENLLDSTCAHQYPTHSELPPTLGMTRSERLMIERSKNVDFVNNSTRLRDFSFIDSSVSYSVDARFIGKASMYNEKIGPNNADNGLKTIINSSGDEFLILKDTRHVLRIVQETRKYSDMAARLEKARYSKLYFDNLMSRVDEQIALAEEMVNAMTKKNTTSLSSIPSLVSASSDSSSLEVSRPEVSLRHSSTVETEILKCRQLYKPKPHNSEKSAFQAQYQMYKVFFPMQKKGLARSSYLGTLVASTSKAPLILDYVEPLQFRGSKSMDPSSWIVDIPIDLEYVFSSALISEEPSVPKLPEIKSVSAELIVFTTKAERHALPIEINHDMLFEGNKQLNKVHKLVYDYGSEYFDNLIIKPLRLKLNRLRKLSSLIGKQNFRIDGQLACDIQQLGSMQTKYIIMVVDDLKLSDQNCRESEYTGWKLRDGGDTKAATPPTYKRRYNLTANLGTLRLKTDSFRTGAAYDNFCLVPSFQLCNIARLYYLKVALTLRKGEVVLLHVPVEIEKK